MFRVVFIIVELTLSIVLLTSFGKKFLIPRVLNSKSDFEAMSIIVKLFHFAGYQYSRESVEKILSAGVFVSVLLGFNFSLLMAIVFPIIFITATMIFLIKKSHQKKTLDSCINDEISFAVARSMRAGQTLESSLRAVNEQFPKTYLISGLCNYLDAGLSTKVAVSRLCGFNNEISTPEKVFCATVAIAHQMGGNSARIFERIGDTFHLSYELKSDTSAALAQVRMSAIVISVLPIVMILISFITGSDSISFLFTKPIGWGCLVVGVGLETIGVKWMNQLIKNGVGIWSY